MAAQTTDDSGPVVPFDIEKGERENTQSSNKQGGQEQSNVALVSDHKSERGVSNGDVDLEKTGLPLSKAKAIALVATVTGASFLNIVSLQAAVLILPRIGDDLDIPVGRQQWILSSYNIAFGCFLLLWGRIADIYGKRLIFILGSAFVVPVTAFNPLMPNEITFDLFRAFQGLAAAANVPTAIGILGVTFPPGKAKNYAFSAYSAGAPLGAIFGNILSGLISNYAHWKWVFWALSILAALVAIGGYFVIPVPPPAANRPDAGLSLTKSVDWLGGALITAGQIALLFSLTEGNIVGWNTVWIYMLLVIALLLIGIFAAWQWYQEKHTSRAPLMKISLFKNVQFTASLLIMGAGFGTVSDFAVLATYLWQDFQGLSPLQTMLRFLPGGIFGVIVAIIVSRLISKVPTYMLLMTGEVALCICFILMAIPIPADTSYFAYGFIALFLCVIGADTAWPTLTMFMSKSLPQEDQALGGGLINTSGQLGRALALAVTTAVQTAVVAREKGVPVQEVGQIEAWDPAALKGIRAAGWFNMALAASCLVLCGLTFRKSGIVGKIPDRPARTAGEEGIMNEEDTGRL